MRRGSTTTTTTTTMTRDEDMSEMWACKEPEAMTAGPKENGMHGLLFYYLGLLLW